MTVFENHPKHGLRISVAFSLVSCNYHSKLLLAMEGLLQIRISKYQNSFFSPPVPS